MILVDTSIWVEHVRHADHRLVHLLDNDRILGHPFVVGELALGGFKPEVLWALDKLPRAVVAQDDEVLDVIERRRFAGRGIGYVDAHLLASALLSDGVTIWTADNKMRSLADEMGLSAKSVH